jgi:hypothetical protein
MKPLHPKDIGLILSYKCQSSCAHCLYNCGPDWVDWMAPSNVQEALESMLIWDHNFQVHITGGEPFLNYPLLKDAVRQAVRLGIPCYVETNAGWCMREQLAERRFSELYNCGLSAVLISCSPFHAESIPPERTLLGIEKAIQVFGSQNVIVYLADWMQQVAGNDIQGTTPLDHYISLYGEQDAGRLFWEGYSLIPGGRSAYRLGHLVDKYSPERFLNENCSMEILYAPHSHFDQYGNYISGFCGGLRVGSWRNLPQLLGEYSNMRYPRLVKELVDSGPYGLFQFAVEVYGYMPIEEGYVGKCHLCVDVRSHLAKREAFFELQPGLFYSMV